MRKFLGTAIEYTGLGNGKGELSFNKCVTVAAMAVFGYAVRQIIIELRIVPPWYVWSFGFGALGAGFGLKGYLGAASRRNENVLQNDSTALTGNLAEMIKAVKERNVDDGFQPSGQVPTVFHD